jgi:hypothetical protein
LQIFWTVIELSELVRGREAHLMPPNPPGLVE